MPLNLWWARNDGIGGHAWLDDAQLAALAEEMVAQGMAVREDGDAPGIPLPALAPGGRVTGPQVSDALARAQPEPTGIADAALWEDWLAFLEGASRSGGIVAG